jgi:phosphatidylcholine synthase
MMVACAWGVHLLTALGAVLGLLAIHYTSLGDIRAAFMVMASATVIDSADGPLARALRVSERAPALDGALLDNIVDYLTYVIAPLYLMLHVGILARGWPGIVIASAVCLASAYGFCHVEAKQAHFRGFPSYWNLVAFYLFCLHLRPAINMAIVGVLTALVPIPIRYIYPNRTVALRPVTLTLSAMWAIVTLSMVPQLPAVNSLLLVVSLSFVFYYFVTSFILHALELWTAGDQRISHESG